MEKNSILPTYKEWSKHSDSYKKLIKQQPRSSFEKKIMYPFVFVLCFILAIIIFSFINSMKQKLKEAERVSYRTSNKYKKIIKEGIIFDTVEYHEI